jgi:putative addiction module component (TIGR02574 family)
MIHTKVIPDDVLVSVSFYVPKSYIGKELDVIAFTQSEGIQKNTIVAQIDGLNLSKADKIELTNRVESYLENPTNVTPWEKVKEDIRKQL